MIEYVKIEGFKSIKSMGLELGPVNILIGSNGSGKSNFISFFKLINALFNQRFQKYVAAERADNILYFGRKITKELFTEVIFRKANSLNIYRLEIAQTSDGGLYIKKESSGYKQEDNDNPKFFWQENIEESHIPYSNTYRNKYLSEYLENIQVFHFHDTSSTSPLRRFCDINDNLYLRQDGRNLPAFLYFLKTKHSKIFDRIEKTIQSVAPYIDKFILYPAKLNDQDIELRWIDKNDPESNFSAYQLSDGTLRFIALATLLMQPEPPETIIIDEPELGLHPFAISKLAGMIQAAAGKVQVIVATQSPGFISHFSPEDIIVADRSEVEKQSIFQRLSSENLAAWLNDYSLGDLWERNIINAAQPFTK